MSLSTFFHNALGFPKETLQLIVFASICGVIDPRWGFLVLGAAAGFLLLQPTLA